jgi:hypothetical protein
MQAAVARIYDLTVYFIVTPECFRMAAFLDPACFCGKYSVIIAAR